MSTILLTGASRGIGKAARQAFEQAGARVIAHASRARAPDADESDYLCADFREADAVARLWEEALERAGGRIDVLVNNAGIFEANPLARARGEWDEWLARWRETLAINLDASALLSAMAVRHWLDRGEAGRIVFVASRAGHRGDSPDHWHYAASKGAMLALHKTIARGYARQNILSFAVAPGFTDTAMAGDYLESRGGEGLLADIPLGRVATPEEIARILRFCALEAPPSMTGAVIDANGASHVR